MKRVLLVDMDFILSEYISKKMHNMGIMVQKASGTEQVLSYMERVKPDCIIVDYSLDRDEILSMFEQKWANASIRSIPALVIAESLQKNDSGLFTSYGVKNIVMKPVRADELLQKIGGLIKVQFTFDITQSLVECSVNEGIIFVEIAYGLNRDRIELAQYRMQELIKLYNLTAVKVLIMMSNLTISFLDTANLEYLIDNILAIPNSSKEGIKVLTASDFVKDFLDNHPKYKGIESAPTLQELLDTLSSDKINGIDMISLDKPDKQQKASSISTKLNFDKLENTNIAVVDDDIVVRDTMTGIFKTVKAKVKTYEDAETFLKDFKNEKFNLIFLDVVLPGMTGLKCLERLRLMDCPIPVVILSSVNGRDNIIKAFERGAKQYLVKPIKSDLIIAKTMEILGGLL
ncbi:MAG: response regulator [Treponema sp.]